MSKIEKLRFSTSNVKKREEISKVSDIPFMYSIDLPEIDSDDYILVAQHKARDIYLKENSEGIIVEDSILIIDGEVCTDIKFKFDDFVKNIDKYKGKSVSFIVTMSVVLNQNIYCFKGVLNGLLDTPKDDGYVFDPYIFIDTDNGIKSLARLEKEGLKERYSPRTKAVKLLYNFFMNGVKDKDILVIDLNEIEDWQGNYQKQIINYNSNNKKPTYKL